MAWPSRSMASRLAAGQGIVGPEPGYTLPVALPNFARPSPAIGDASVCRRSIALEMLTEMAVALFR
jgi:hypothetical protein